MSDLGHIKLTGRPLIISDVDDVVLKFIDPFQLYLEDVGFRFLPRSFRLNGNIISKADQQPVDESRIQALLSDFFDKQERHQAPFEDAVTTLQSLAAHADIVFLTAMPPIFADIRRKHLNALGLEFAMVASEEAKGPIAARLCPGPQTATVFVDDMAHNLASVETHLPHSLLVHQAPDSPVHQHSPPPPTAAKRAGNWVETAPMILAHFGV